MLTKIKMTKEVEVLDNEMQSRYDKVHGDEGICHILVELFNAVAEIRMNGDYDRLLEEEVEGGTIRRLAMYFLRNEIAVEVSKTSRIFYH